MRLLLEKCCKLFWISIWNIRIWRALDNVFDNVIVMIYMVFFRVINTALNEVKEESFSRRKSGEFFSKILSLQRCKLINSLYDYISHRMSDILRNLACYIANQLCLYFYYLPRIIEDVLIKFRPIFHRTWNHVLSFYKYKSNEYSFYAWTCKWNAKWTGRSSYRTFKNILWKKRLCSDKLAYYVYYVFSLKF